jgi:hypothetical protein
MHYPITRFLEGHGQWWYVNAVFNAVYITVLFFFTIDWAKPHRRFVSQSLTLLPTHSRCRGCLFSLDHTQTHTTVGRTPLDEGSARRRDNTNTVQEKKIHAPVGIRTHDPSKRSAADLRLRPRGHWDRHTKAEFSKYSCLRRLLCCLIRSGPNDALTHRVIRKFLHTNSTQRHFISPCFSITGMPYFA